MRPRRFTEEEIAQAIRQVGAGTPAEQVCRRMDVTQATFSRWRRDYARTVGREPRNVRELREDNQKLKRIMADLLLERQGASERYVKHS